MVYAHERESRVDDLVQDAQVQSVGGLNLLPHRQRRAAQRIDPDLHPGAADGGQIDDFGQRRHIRRDEIPFLGVGQRLSKRHGLHARQSGLQQLVGAALHGSGHVGIGGTTAGWVVFEAAVVGRVVRGRDDDAVGEVACAATVVGEDGVRDRRRRRVFIVRRHHHVDAIARQHFERARACRLRRCMGIDAEEQRSVDAICRAPIAHRLRHGEDMRLVERRTEGGPTVARGAEGDALGRIGRIGLSSEIGGDQPRHIDEGSGIDRFAGGGILGSHMTSQDR